MHNACLAMVATSLVIGWAALAQNAPPLPPTNTTGPAGAPWFQKLLVGGIQSAMSLKPFCRQSAHWRS